MKNYEFHVQWSEEDGEYLATVGEFPGLSAFGATPDEALAEARIALEGFIETYNERGIPLPDPLTDDGRERTPEASQLHR